MIVTGIITQSVGLDGKGDWLRVRQELGRRMTAITRCLSPFSQPANLHPSQNTPDNLGDVGPHGSGVVEYLFGIDLDENVRFGDVRDDRQP